MKHSRTFVWAERNERLGWLPADAPNFDPGSPVHVAHDTLEHLSGGEDFKNELLAFGSTLFGRAFMDDTDGMINIMASDLSGFLIERKFKVPDIPAHWLDKPLNNQRAERLLGDVVYATTSMAVLRTLFRVDMATAEHALVKAIHWIRLGYRIAERRFHGNHAMLDSMFGRIMDNVMADYERKEPKLGDLLTVSFDTEANRVHLHREKEVTP